MWHTLLKMVDQYYLLMTPAVFALQPLIAASSPWKAFLAHATLPLIMSRIALGHTIPIELRHIICIANIIVYGHHNFSRCPQEIATIAGRGQWYQNAVVGLETSFHSWFAFPAFVSDSQHSLLPSEALSVQNLEPGKVIYCYS